MNNLLFVYRPRFQSKCISEKQCEWGINVSPISACSLTKKNCESMGADVAKNKPFNCIAHRKADGGISKTYKQLIHNGGRRHHRPSRHVSKKKCCNVSCLVQREKKHYKGRKRKNTSVFFLQTKKVCHYRKFVVIAISFRPFKTAIMADIKPLSLFMSSDSRPEKDNTS